MSEIAEQATDKAMEAGEVQEQEESSSKPQELAVATTDGGGGDADPTRDAFGNHCEYFLSSLGLAVGLGNIWRFPFQCYQNGGGTFLFPYLLMLLLVGLPLLFLEMALGQWAGLSSIKIFSRMSPGLRGMGYGMVIIPTLINFYYAVVMAYALYFLCMGFTADGKLPWGLCDHDYNSEYCYSLVQAKACNVSDDGLIKYEVFYDNNCTSVEDFCEMFGYESNRDNASDFTYCYNYTSDLTESILVDNVTHRVSASEEYYYKHVLQMSVNWSLNDDGLFKAFVVTEGDDANSWESWGDVNWKIAGCLLACWTLVCLSLIKGVQSYGKVVYFTTLFPYVVLTTLLIYASTLDGFQDGIEFYIIPKWEKLGDFAVWKAAATQIFYSLGVAVGSQLLLSSYNPFNTNCHRDALIIGVCNSLTSIYAGFVVFGVVGFLAHTKGVRVEDAVDAGPALAFIAYPEAVTQMTPGPLFSFLFFLMLNLLAISSICGSWEAFVASVLDEFPQLRNKRLIVMSTSCLGAFLFGFPMCFEAGPLLFTQMDTRTANAIALMAFVELAIVAYFYGIDPFFVHIDEMEMKIPKFMKIFWRSTWQVITPLIIGIVLITGYAAAREDKYLGYTYPDSAQALGWVIELLPIGIVVCVSLWYVLKKLCQGEDIRFLEPGPMMTPKYSWGPRADSGLVKQDQGLENHGYAP